MTTRQSSRSVLITGASTGIGYAAAKVLIQRGLHVFGSVRKPADGDRLAGDFGEAFTPLVFDVTDRPSIDAAAKQTAEALNGANLLGLVNNAGVAVPGPLAHMPVEEVLRQLEINVTGALQVTQAFLPYLGMDRGRSGGPGRIVNISSVAGKRGAPFLGPYSASKHALEGLSESLRRELMLYGIDVIIVAPGAVATPIWDKAEEQEVAPYRDTDYVEALLKLQKTMVDRGRKRGLPPEVVGRKIYEALTVRKPKTRYAVVPSLLQDVILPAILPKRILDRMIAKMFGLQRR